MPTTNNQDRSGSDLLLPDALHLRNALLEGLSNKPITTITTIKPVELYNYYVKVNTAFIIYVKTFREQNTSPSLEHQLRVYKEIFNLDGTGLVIEAACVAWLTTDDFRWDKARPNEPTSHISYGLILDNKVTMSVLRVGQFLTLDASGMEQARLKLSSDSRFDIHVAAVETVTNCPLFRNRDKAELEREILNGGRSVDY